DVISPKLGEFQTGCPAELAITVRPVSGPFRLTWFSKLNASPRIVSVMCSPTRKRRATARSKLTSPGFRVVFRPSVPMPSNGKTGRRLRRDPVNRGQVGESGKAAALGGNSEGIAAPSDVRFGA